MEKKLYKSRLGLAAKVRDLHQWKLENMIEEVGRVEVEDDEE